MLLPSSPWHLFSSHFSFFFLFFSSSVLASLCLSLSLSSLTHSTHSFLLHFSPLTLLLSLSLSLSPSPLPYSTTFITCPADPKATLGIKLPFLVMIIKNLKKYFTFEVQVREEKWSERSERCVRKRRSREEEIEEEWKGEK